MTVINAPNLANGPVLRCILLPMNFTAKLWGGPLVRSRPPGRLGGTRASHADQGSAPQFTDTRFRMNWTLLYCAALAFGGLAGAQNRQGNLQFDMQAIAQALGVQCEYCHSAERGSGLPEPKKDIAPQMMAMTREIHTRVQTATVNAAQEA